MTGADRARTIQKRLISRCLVSAAFALAVSAPAQTLLTVTPAFPLTPVGQSVTRNVTITINSGGNSVIFNSIALAPGFGDFTVGTITGCVVDGATANTDGAVCTIPITFAPRLPGNASAASPIARSAPLLVNDVENGTPAQYAFGLTGSGTTPLPVIVPGIISDIVGNDISLPSGFSGDGGLAGSAVFNQPMGLAVDNAGNIYISDTGNCVVRRVDKATQIITTVAGIGQNCGAGTDGIAATASMLSSNAGIALDAAGNLYIVDSGNSAVRMVSAATGIITTVAGTLGVAGYGGDGSAANLVGTALLNNPGALAVDGAGNLFIADVGNETIRKVQASTGIISTTATSMLTQGVAVDSLGNVFIADVNTVSIQRVDAVTGAVSTFLSLQSTFGATPTGLAIDASDNLHFTLYGSNGNVYKLPADSSTPIVEAGTGGYIVGNFFGPGDGGAATSAGLNAPRDVVVDGAGNLYILEEEGVRFVDSTGTQTTPIGYWLLTYPEDNPLLPLGVASPAQSVMIFNGDIATPAGGTAKPLGVYFNNGLNLPFAIVASTSGQDCSAATASVSIPLNPAAFCTLSMNFTPNATGSVTAGTSFFETSSATPLTQNVGLIGVGGVSAVTLSPTQLTFLESVGVTTPVQTVTLTNNMPNAIAISSIGFVTNAAGGTYLNQTNTCPAMLPGNSSCTIAVTFTPESGGSNGNSLDVYYALDPVQGSYEGVAQADIEEDAFNGGGNLNPSAANFGAQPLGSTSAPIVIQLNSTGAPPTYTWPLGINSMTITGTDAAQFAIQGTTCGLSVAVGANCTISVVFKPLGGSPAGGFNANLTVAYNSGTNPPLSIPLSGSANGTLIIDEMIHVLDTPTVAPATVLALNEIIHETDSDVMLQPVQIVIPETVTFSDTPQFYEATVLAMSETIHVNDVPNLVASTLIPIGETIQVSDASTPVASKLIPIAETIQLSDASAPVPSMLIPIAETIHLSDGVQIGKIQPLATITSPAGPLVYGATLGITASASYNNVSVAGAFTYTAMSSGGPAFAVTAATVLPAGTYTLTASFAPVDSVRYKTASATASLAVNKATPSSVSLSSSVNPILIQNATSLTATVSSTVSVPTGTVTFYDNTASTALASSPLNGGVATASINTLALGTHSITAIYLGDANFVTLISAAVSEQVDDFSLSISTSSGNAPTQTIVPGGTATYDFVISPAGAATFPAAIALSVSGLPAGATYTITPSTIASGASATSITLMIKVPKQTATLKTGEKLVPITFALLLLSYARCKRSRSGKLPRLVSLLLLIAGMTSAASLTGCGSTKGFSAQPPQTYNIVITGTSGALTRSTSVSLTVE